MPIRWDKLTFKAQEAVPGPASWASVASATTIASPE